MRRGLTTGSEQISLIQKYLDQRVSTRAKAE